MMINIKGIPLLHEDKCANLFNIRGILTGHFMVKPLIKWLPKIKGFYTNEERESYLFKNIEPGFYLIGLEIITAINLYSGFYGDLFRGYGLVLTKSYPVVKHKAKHKYTSMVYLKFEHISRVVSDSIISIDN